MYLDLKGLVCPEFLCYNHSMAKVDIKLGYSCNNECVHCVISDYRDLVLSRGLPLDVSADDYQKEMEEAQARGMDRIVLTGGEPTIRPDLEILVAKARDLGFQIDMQTNGRRFCDLEFCRRLADIASIHYCIALHGPDSEVHDSITQRPGSFDETVQGIKHLVALGQRVSGKLVISRLNLPVLVETTELFISLGVSHISLTFPHACGNARTHFDQVMPTYREVREPLHRALDLCIQQCVSADTEAMPFCQMRGYEEFVAELFLAQETGTLLKQYGEEELIDWETKRPSIKRKFPQCGQCRFDAICEGPWMEYPEQRGSDEFEPVPGPPIRDVREVQDGDFLQGLAGAPVLANPLPMTCG